MQRVVVIVLDMVLPETGKGKDLPGAFIADLALRLQESKPERGLHRAGF